MTAPAFKEIVLDYADVGATPELLDHLSTLACAGEFLWCASDEGRTIECLRIDGDRRYKIHRQVCLDDVFEGIPGRKKRKGNEADVESIDITGGRLWICGSHCRVPRNVNEPARLPASRCLLGTVKLKSHGAAIEDAGQTLPFKGEGSLRVRLEGNPFLAPFLHLPTKENGLDIEGMVVVKDKILLGLRGPLIDGFAVVLEVQIENGLRLGDRAPVTHFLDLGGLGIRDLARAGGEILVLAGPVSSADRPFRVYRWKPRDAGRVYCPDEPVLDDWTKNKERPEGICCVPFDGADGILILYDSPGRGRIRGNRYHADWYRLPN